MFLVSGQAAQAFIAFGVNLLLVRYLTPEDFGRFALALAGVALVYTLLSLQINVLVIRVSESRFEEVVKDRYFNALLIETAVAGAVAICWLVVTNSLEPWSAGLVVAVGLRHWAHTNVSFFDRSMPYRKLAFAETASAMASHLLALALIVLGGSGVVLFIREYVLTLVTLAGLWMVGGITLRIPRLITVHEWRVVFHEARGVWLDCVLENSFQRLVILLVGLLAGDRLVGFFFQAQRLAMVPNQFLAPILIRVAANWFGRTEDATTRRVGRNRILLVVAGPLACLGVLCVVFADPIIPWLFGSTWASSALLLAAMSGLVVFLSLFEVLKVYCWSTERMGPLLKGRIIQYLGCALPVAAVIGFSYPGGLALAIGQSLAYVGAFFATFLLLKGQEAA